MRRIAIYCFVFLFVFFGFIYSALIWQVWQHGQHLAAAENYDGVLVLGARSYIDGKPNPCLVTRVIKGVSLVSHSSEKKILFSGGTDHEDGKNESKTMLEISGLDSQYVLLEPNSTSTYENLLFSNEIAHKHNLNRLALVSESFHLYRALLVANKLGMDTTLVAAEGNTCWVKIFKEPFAIISYWLKGQI